MKRRLVPFLVSLASVCAIQADPISDPVTEITFTGVCSDCAGEAVAILSVTDFRPDTVFDLTLSDFVSFQYLGTDLVKPYTIDSSSVLSVSGMLGPALPGSYDIEVLTTGARLNFLSFSDGSWELAPSASGQGLDDFGATSCYSLGPCDSLASAPVPEPAAMPLLALVLGALSYSACRRRAGTRALR